MLDTLADKESAVESIRVANEQRDDGVKFYGDDFYKTVRRRVCSDRAEC